MNASMKMKGFYAAALAIVGTFMLFFDEGGDDYLIPSSIQSRTLEANVKELDLAICVQGAVRTFANENVTKSFEQLHFPPNTHVFHYMFVGKELSARGQEAVGPDQAPAMARALARSTAFQFQYQENDFSCDNQANGKFHKIAECAKLVDTFSRENDVTFKAIAFVRPDLIWLREDFPPVHTIVEDSSDWYAYNTDEIFAISGSETAREVAMNVEQAECCDSVLREPKHCFRDGFKESRTNWIQERYFETNLQSHFYNEKRLGLSVIARGGMHAKPGHMHGKFRSEVLRCGVPQTSPVVTGFPKLHRRKQVRVLEHLLSITHLEECMYSNYDAADNLSASSLRRKLRQRHPKFINPSFTDPKVVTVKETIGPSFISDIAPDESAMLNKLSDINVWGTPAKLTSFGYKWRDDQCHIDETLQSKKKRAALCLYGGISPYHKKLGVHGSSAPDISDLSNVDWVAALYDKNILPEGDFELDLFIHTWSETYFCTIARSFDGTRFTIRSIIAESNERHMNELFPKIREEVAGRPAGSISNHKFFKQSSMYFSINKALALALDYSDNCGFEYDLLISARPDVLLGEPLSFYDNNGEKTRLHQALSPYNEVLHGHLDDPSVLRGDGDLLPNGDFHHIFNAANARTFVEKMFPPPSQKWPDIVKLTSRLGAHTGWVQEFARNNGIVILP